VQPLTFTHHGTEGLPLLTRGVDAEGRHQRTVYIPAAQLRGRLRHEAALAELRSGGDLSADEIRQVTQGTRAAASARGLASGFGSAVQEVLARSQYAEARKTGRRNFAQGVEALTQQRTAADRNYISGSFAQAAGFFDPQMRLYGRGGSVVSGQTQGVGQFSPFLNASVSVAESNQQAEIARAQMEQQDKQFNASMAWDQQSFGMNRTDSLANASANRKASNNAAVASGVGAAAGLLALAFL
jgi:hypothetical protein